MRIAVNTRMLLPGKMEGIGNFTCETMQRITKQHKEHEFIFIFDRTFNTDYIFSDNIIPYSISPQARHPFLWYLWYEWSLPYLFKKLKPDLFIGTDGYLSLSSNTPSIAVIHDLNFEHYPKDLPFFNSKFYRHYFPRYVKQAKRIAAVSQFTKNDIVNTYHVNPDKIDVVYNGVNETFKPINEEISHSVREIFSKGKPYFLFVGSLHQRKNIANLLRAFDDFKKTISSPMQLILTGQKRWWTNEMEEVYNAMTFKSDVIFTGRVSEDNLQKITAAAFAVTYVSTFEGFGIPIIEAMRCNVPVITSNVTSMPEIAGGSALLCDPFSITSISNAMSNIFMDKNLRNSLIEKGNQRQAYFSWQKSADELWKCVEKVIK